MATIIIFWFVAGAWASTPQDASGASHTPTGTEDSLVEGARDADVVYVFTVPARPPGVIRYAIIVYTLIIFLLLFCMFPPFDTILIPMSSLRPEREWRRITVEAKAMTERRRAQGLDVDNMSDETVVLPAVQHEEPPIPMRTHTTGSRNRMLL